MKTEKIICPKCRATGTCVIVPRLSHFNLLAFIAGGVILSLLWSGSRPTDLKCAACEHRFARHTVGARVALSIFWVLIGIIGLGLLAWMMFAE